MHKVVTSCTDCICFQMDEEMFVTGCTLANKRHYNLDYYWADCHKLTPPPPDWCPLRKEPLTISLVIDTED